MAETKGIFLTQRIGRTIDEEENKMNLFELVKASVTVKQAAELYGHEANRGDMICCPFHDDRHPSMKLNKDYFYCFGCGPPAM